MESPQVMSGGDKKWRGQPLVATSRMAPSPTVDGGRMATKDCRHLKLPMELARGPLLRKSLHRKLTRPRWNEIRAGEIVRTRGRCEN